MPAAQGSMISPQKEISLGEMLTIEYEEPHRTICECCGNASTTLTGFVSEDGDAYAVYYASFAEEHPHVKAVVSLGIWWEGGTPKDRVAFAVVLWEDKDQFGVRLVDAEESPWKDAELLGRMLNRDEALQHPRVKDAFHITDHMVEEDPEIIAFFSRRRAPGHE